MSSQDHSRLRIWSAERPVPRRLPMVLSVRLCPPLQSSCRIDLWGQLASSTFRRPSSRSTSSRWGGCRCRNRQQSSYLAQIWPWWRTSAPTWLWGRDWRPWIVRPCPRLPAHLFVLCRYCEPIIRKPFPISFRIFIEQPCTSWCGQCAKDWMSPRALSSLARPGQPALGTAPLCLNSKRCWLVCWLAFANWLGLTSWTSCLYRGLAFIVYLNIIFSFIINNEQPEKIIKKLETTRSSARPWIVEECKNFWGQPQRLSGERNAFHKLATDDLVEEALFDGPLQKQLVKLAEQY